MPGTFEQEVLNTAVINNGTWIDARAFNVPYTITVEGILAGDVVQIRVSNILGETAPLDTDHQFQYSTDVTADGRVEVLAPYKWLKVRRTAQAGGGTTKAKLFTQILLG